MKLNLFYAVCTVLLLTLSLSISVATASPTESFQYDSQQHDRRALDEGIDFGVARECSELRYLNSDQIDNLFFSYRKGLPHNMGNTLAAIALHESHAGEIPVNFSDPSAGIYHVTLRNAIKYIGWEDTSYNRNILGMRMINDRDLAANMALSLLKYWELQYGVGSWTKIWASYNAGWEYENGLYYRDIIANHIRTFQSCGLFDHIDNEVDIIQ